MRKKSSYTYNVYNKHGRRVIAIVDLNQGMSVTNNIENVIKEIESIEGIVARKHMVIYQDSDGRWDGFDYAEQEFIHLGSQTATEAYNEYSKINNIIGLM